MLRRLPSRLVTLALLSSTAQLASLALRVDEAGPAVLPPAGPAAGLPERQLLAPGLVGALAGSPEAPQVSPAVAARAAQAARRRQTARVGPQLYYVVLPGPPAVEVIPAGIKPGAPAAVAATRARLGELDREHAALRPALEQAGAKVVGELVRTANVLQVLAEPDVAERLVALPGVERVEATPLVGRALASAVPFVGGYKAWSQGATPVHGEGMRVGIVDTGIDYTHADFGGSGDPADYLANDSKIIEPGSFPTEKVIGGYDFVGDAYDASESGSAAPKPDGDPLDCAGMQSMMIQGGHGTHVAGIVAGGGVTIDKKAYLGPYTADLSPFAFRVGPGVAPAAKLYALKVFGCSGSTGATAQALEWASDPDNDGDLSDRLDVVNLSLGGSYGVGSSTDSGVVKSLVALGSVVVIAAGNEGNTFYVTGWPSTSTEALSVAATSDAIAFGAIKIEAPASIAGTVAAAEGAFSAPLAQTGPITGELVATKPAGACAAVTNGAEIAGKIALIERGSCTFVKKVKAAEAAGAIAVVVTDHEEEDYPLVMAGDGSSSDVPALLVRKVDGDAIRQHLAEGVTVRLDVTQVFQSSVGADQMADFSSRGPRALDNLLKPEIGAPGLAIDSAGVSAGSGPRQLSGTSMACPMVAGAAALVRQAHPDLPASEIKALLMNTAVAAKGPAGEGVPVSLVGAGRLEVAGAVAATVTVSAESPPGAVGVSFGAIITATTQVESRVVVVRNHGLTPISLSATAAPTYEMAGITLTVEPSVLEVPAGGEASVTLQLQVEPSKLPEETPDPLTPPEVFNQPRHFLTEAAGQLAFSETASGAPVAHVPYYSIVRAAAERSAVAPVGCLGVPAGESIFLPLEGDSAHASPVVSAFELGTTSLEKQNPSPLAKMTDLVAVGAATNVPTAESFAKASVYFGVAIAGQWTTPALGPQTLVRVLIDTNLDKKSDYEIRAEALTGQGPYGDVLVADTYDLKTGQVVSRRFLNIFGRNTLDTQPFDNSVLVMPVTLGDIKLKQTSAKFGYTVSTMPFTNGQLSDQTPWVTYDPTAPRIDTARGGLMNRPMYPGGQPIEVFINDPTAKLPDVLLLHHTNVLGKRWQVVKLSDGPAPVSLSVTQQAPEQAVKGKPVTVEVLVTNDSSAEAKGASLALSATGGQLVSASTPDGDCVTADDGGLTCPLSPLASGASVTVTTSLVASAQLGTLALTAAVSTPDSCEATPDDNLATSQVKLVAPGTGGAAGKGGAGQAGGAQGGKAGAGQGGKAGAAGASAAGRGGAGQAGATVDEGAGLEPGGGFDCSVSAGPSSAADRAGGLAMLLAAFGLVRRRRTPVPAGRRGRDL